MFCEEVKIQGPVKVDIEGKSDDFVLGVLAAINTGNSNGFGFIGDTVKYNRNIYDKITVKTNDYIKRDGIKSRVDFENRNKYYSNNLSHLIKLYSIYESVENKKYERLQKIDVDESKFACVIIHEVNPQQRVIGHDGDLIYLTLFYNKTKDFIDGIKYLLEIDNTKYKFFHNVAY